MLDSLNLHQADLVYFLVSFLWGLKYSESFGEIFWRAVVGLVQKGIFATFFACSRELLARCHKVNFHNLPLLKTLFDRALQQTGYFWSIADVLMVPRLPIRVFSFACLALKFHLVKLSAVS